MLFLFSTGLFNISDKLLVSMDILLEWRELFKRSSPISNVIASKLESLKQKSKYAVGSYINMHIYHLSFFFFRWLTIVCHTWIYFSRKKTVFDIGTCCSDTYGDLIISLVDPLLSQLLQLQIQYSHHFPTTFIMCVSEWCQPWANGVYCRTSLQWLLLLWGDNRQRPWWCHLWYLWHMSRGVTWGWEWKELLFQQSGIFEIGPFQSTQHSIRWNSHT